MCSSCGYNNCCCGNSTTTYTLQPMAELSGPAYETNIFTPVLTFGGGSSGMTAALAGTYYMVDSFFHFTIQVSMSVKGASTGTILIDNLPYYGGSLVHYPLLYAGTGISPGSGNLLVPEVYGDNAIRFLAISQTAGTISALTHAAVSATADFTVQGFFRVA